MMNKDNIDWKEFARELIWYNIVYRKNVDSGYDIMLIDVPGRAKKGDIGHHRIQSYLPPLSYKPLTWKQLALELDLWTEYLTPDGHDCIQCPVSKTCTAYFKGEADHERCNWWGENMTKKD